MSEQTPFKLIPKYKQIHDIVHGYINISNLAQMIIDTTIFQRLKKLKQLGTCVYVYTSALHTRFEHSLGCYNLAGKIIKTISEYSKKDHINDYLKTIPELKEYFNDKEVCLDEYVMELIKIAALNHDLGHGPYCHLYDIFIEEKNKNTHEYRSGLLIELIIKNNKTLSSIIRPSEIQLIKNLINPNENHTGFIYQIVSNSINGLDIDKYDYIMRDSYMLGFGNSFDCSRLINDVVVIDNNICYPKQVVCEIFKMYQSRYILHKQVYCHKMVIAAQLMIIEILTYLDPILKLTDSADDMNEFCKLTDEYILTSIDHLTSKYCTIDKKYDDNIKKAKELINRINRHDLFAFVGTILSDSEIKLDESLFNDIDMNNIVIHRATIGYYTGKKKNPFDNIYTISTKIINGNMEAKKIKQHDISYLIPDKQQENIVMVFYKDRTDTKTIDTLRKRIDSL